MLGDSHVTSVIYPDKVEELLKEAYPDVEFAYYGKVGAGYYTYNNKPELLDTVYSFEPDILIITLGGNDCYTPKFQKEKFLSDVDIFYHNFKNDFPDCQIVFFTPFYNMFKAGKKSKREINYMNGDCAEALIEFSNAHSGTYVIDNNAEHGMDYIEQPGLLRKDGVHLTKEGYEKLGIELGEGLLELGIIDNNSPTTHKKPISSNEY